MDELCPDEGAASLALALEVVIRWDVGDVGRRGGLSSEKLKSSTTDVTARGEKGDSGMRRKYHIQSESID